MPINTNLNQSPYFDDYDQDKQFNRILFKPGFAVQARELTQLQSILQNQVQQFGDNIFKEGSIVKGCTFTNIDDLKYVKLKEGTVTTFNPTLYISKVVIEPVAGGQEQEVDNVYVMTGQTSGLRAQIISAVRGSQGTSAATAPNNTFFIKYLNTTPGYSQFSQGEKFDITLTKYKRGTNEPLSTSTPVILPTVGTDSVTVWNDSDAVGNSFGIESSPGVIFQKGHFLYASEQILIVENYNRIPADKSVGFHIAENTVNALTDDSLYDNAFGSKNQNAPGADRLQLVPSLTVKTPVQAKEDADFFSLVRYQNGNAVTLRDVSQYNAIGEELARRTYEESGNYILEEFPVRSDDRIPQGEATSKVHALVGQGTAYVKGFRVENSGERSFEIDPITTTDIVDNQSIGTDYGHYVNITSITGHVDIDYTPVTLQDSGGSSIGQAIAVNVTRNRLYLSALSMTGSIADLAKVSDGNGTIQVDSVLQEAAKKSLIFDSGLISTFDMTDTLIPVRAKEEVTHTGGAITITANPGEDFVCQNTVNDILVVEKTNNVFREASAVTVTNNNSELNITIDAGAASPVYVYYNKRLVGSTGVDSYNKIVREPWVKVSYAGNANAGNSKYSLGFPDVFGITEIKTIGTGLGGIDEDFTNSFRLKTNQKDQFYDISYMEHIPGRPKPEDGTHNLYVKLKVFQISPSTGSYFFNINSYPNTLDRNDIPVHTSDSGRRFNLRDCIDFRPHCDKDTAVGYGDVTVILAGPITNAVGFLTATFSDFGAPLIPAAQDGITTDIEHYLARIDTIVCDSYGEIKIVKGKESKIPAPVQIESDKLAIANVTIPGFPALSSRQADTQRKREYAISMVPTGIKNYTMKDLHSLEKKIDNMAYYISLNQLESDTQNLTILDENGLSRFKNGFVVDPFNDLRLADVGNPEFRAAVPFAQKILTPEVNTFPIDLKYKTSAGATIFPSTAKGQVATLTRDSNVDIIDQPYATDFRNCVSNFYKYVGEGIISPPYDAAYDTTTNPVSLDIDLTSYFEDFVDNIQRFLPMTDTSIRQIDFERTGRRGAGFATDQITTRQQTIEVGENLINTPVGDFVSNFAFEPFMSSRDIKIYMSGLRPDTDHYFFFDGVDVNAHIIKGTPTANLVEDIERYGDKGITSVKTDSNGVIRAIFHLPAETFYVGDRILEIVDVDQYSSIDSGATSKGFITYRAYNFSVEKSSLTTSTRAPTFDINTTTTFRNVTRRVGGRDPIAQTFFIKKGMGLGSNSVYLSNIDVFFKRVSAENGITLQVREVINGFPTNQVVPFSKVHKLPSQLTSSVSDDASVATTFAFDAPIRLDVEKEYCLVLQPDASDPNYLVYISKVGGLDLTPGASQGTAIVQDWGDGVLFSSTNNSAWQSYQDEDMKFTLRRHNFSASTGSVTLTNNDNEFLTLNNITPSSVSNYFIPGEAIYQNKALTGSTAATGGVVLNSTTITQSNADQSYVIGDFIKITGTGNNIQIVEIVNISDANTIIIKSPWPYPSAPAAAIIPVVKGDISNHDKRNPSKLQLEKSSATAVKQFTVTTYDSNTGAAENPITGADSKVVGSIVTVDNVNLSYVQPMIMRANDSVSATTLEGTLVSPTDLNTTYNTALAFNDNNHFSNQGVIVYSKSNDPTGAKAFDFTVNLTNGSNVTSTPFVDIETSKLIGYQYTLNSDPAESSNYISRVIELASDLDAEDLNVILTGYRPVNSDIKVYVKAQNAFDSSDLDSIGWTELEMFRGVGTFSSTSNIKDYREFQYKIPAANKVGGLPSGAHTYTSTNGTFNEFRKFKIKIALTSTNIHNAPTLRDYRAIALT